MLMIQESLTGPEVVDFDAVQQAADVDVHVVVGTCDEVSLQVPFDVVRRHYDGIV